MVVSAKLPRIITALSSTHRHRDMSTFAILLGKDPKQRDANRRGFRIIEDPRSQEMRKSTCSLVDLRGRGKHLLLVPSDVTQNIDDDRRIV